MNQTADRAIQAIFAERDQWQALLAQEADEVLDVYLDLKSPHAYLAVRPTLEVARDFRVSINFLPYTLSYKTLGVTKEVGPDMQRKPATPAADRKARMYYATAREYAKLQSLPLRSPQRLLDSDLAHRVFLFAKGQGLEVPFAMWVYLHGWASGWRSFQLESLEDLQWACASVGIDTTGLRDFVAQDGEGAQRLAQLMQAAEANGITGAPHYVLGQALRQPTAYSDRLSMMSSPRPA